MQLRYAIVCDYANGTQDGRLNILGVLDRLYAGAFPAVHRTMFFVVSIELGPEDEGEQHEVHVQLMDGDARTLADLRGHFQFGHGDRILNQVHQLNDLPFEAPGLYRFSVFLDGNLAKTIDLELVLMPQPPEAEGDA